MKSSRPRIPSVYGVSKSTKGLLPWSHVSQRMFEAKNYWVCTVSPEGCPYATPVDGLWLDDKLFFGGSRETKWSRNLQRNRAACVHLESATDVVILRGDVRELKSIDRPLAEQLSKLSLQKYGWAPKPEEYEKLDGVYEFTPDVVFAWKQFPKDATRWERASNDD
jgi:nitroimidazol reductase NimA-like FMN-containing flavoprotein (pyridoxamine 5'-phosphate oxidase superfamily)